MNKKLFLALSVCIVGQAYGYTLFYQTPQIGIEQEDLAYIGELLNKLLSDEYMLYTKTLNYHWNVKGPKFYELHLLLEKQYKELAIMMDQIAERSQALGQEAAGLLYEFDEKKLAQYKLSPHQGANRMIASLLEDHEAIIRKLRHDLEKAEEHGDMGTNNFLTGLMENHEKMAWMLRSILEK